MRRIDNLQKMPKIIVRSNFFVLVSLLSFAHIVFAASNSDGVILRPVIEYGSKDLRDPFDNLFRLAKEKKVQSMQTPQEGSGLQMPMPSLENFKVQGIIWGGNFPQAIINNKIFKVGDSIEGIEIIGIDKKGITLSFGGIEANLAIAAYEPALRKGNKEEK